MSVVWVLVGGVWVLGWLVWVFGVVCWVWGPLWEGLGGVWGLGERPVGGFVVQSERGEAGDVVGCG
ncbi:MAG: hypothetical protein KTU85_04255 [Acidimicrobiia bacterium]|nr:hypothetical protein [Acidimicrobiia bacterium]